MERSGLRRYIPSICTTLDAFKMAKTRIAKLFRNGRSQAVRLPQEFRFEGDRVRIRRVDQGVLLEPMIPDAANWFDELDRFDVEPFMAKRCNQPITPRRKIFK
jgi:antitoxin VapB